MAKPKTTAAQHTVRVTAYADAVLRHAAASKGIPEAVLLRLIVDKFVAHWASKHDTTLPPKPPRRPMTDKEIDAWLALPAEERQRRLDAALGREVQLRAGRGGSE